MLFDQDGLPALSRFLAPELLLLIDGRTELGKQLVKQLVKQLGKRSLAPPI